MLPAVVHHPTARALSAGSCWVAWLMSDSEQGSITAAPTPCRARAAISVPMSGARPQSALAPAKIAIPAR